MYEKAEKIQNIDPLELLFDGKMMCIASFVVNLHLLMSENVFRFKRFELSHANSSMRVGTDAVLLGSWFGIPSGCLRDGRVLDVGCGCGIIAMMAAQRLPHCHVLGIDIDSQSVHEATQNAKRSDFAERISFMEKDVRTLCNEDGAGRFFLILCNPPYYTEDTLPPDARRSYARNTAHLSFGELIGAITRLLEPAGTFAVVLPMQARDSFLKETSFEGLHIHRECRIQTVSGKSPKRVLLEFGFEQYDMVNITTLILQDKDGKRSAEYAKLCRDFYL